MDNRERALSFIKRFCGGDVERLAPLLSSDLKLVGPLFQFESRDAYLAALRADPPEEGDVRLLSVSEADDQVSIFYEYRRSGGAVTVAQLFKFKHEKISEILLVFDGREFA